MYVSNDELASDLAGVLAKVREGAEAVVLHDNEDIAIIPPPSPRRHSIAESIQRVRASEKKLGYKPTPDPEFPADVREAEEALNTAGPLREPRKPAVRSCATVAPGTFVVTSSSASRRI